MGPLTGFAPERNRICFLILRIDLKLRIFSNVSIISAPVSSLNDQSLVDTNFLKFLYGFTAVNNNKPLSRYYNRGIIQNRDLRTNQYVLNETKNPLSYFVWCIIYFRHYSRAHACTNPYTDYDMITRPYLRRRFGDWNPSRNTFSIHLMS